MAGSISNIPVHFDVDFLDWYRMRTEATWAMLPPQTPQEVLAEHIRRGVGGQPLAAWHALARWP